MQRLAKAKFCEKKLKVNVGKPKKPPLLDLTKLPARKQSFKLDNEYFWKEGYPIQFKLEALFNKSEEKERLMLLDSSPPECTLNNFKILVTKRRNSHKSSKLNSTRDTVKAVCNTKIQEPISCKKPQYRTSVKNFADDPLDSLHRKYLDLQNQFRDYIARLLKSAVYTLDDEDDERSVENIKESLIKDSELESIVRSLTVKLQEQASIPQKFANDLHLPERSKKAMLQRQIRSDHEALEQSVNLRMSHQKRLSLRKLPNTGLGKLLQDELPTNYLVDMATTWEGIIKTLKLFLL